MIRPEATKQRRLHHGMTLVETVVLIAVSSVLTGIVVTGMASLFRFNSTTSNHAVTQIQLQQLSNRLRSDIHQARIADWDEASSSLRLDFGDSRVIEYHQESSRWVRVETISDAEPVATPFGLDDSFYCQCQSSKITAGEVLRISFNNLPPGKAEQQSRTERAQRLDVVAVIARDVSLTQD